MPQKSEFSMSGADDIEKALLELPVRYQKRGLYNAFQAGAQVILTEAKSQAQNQNIGDGGFVDSIVLSKPQRGQGVGRDSVIVIALKKTHSALAHIFEFGTVERHRNSDGASGKKGNHAGGYTGQIVARPFLRPALDIKGQEAIAMIAKVTKENIETIVAQLAKGQKVSLRRKR